MYFPIDIERTLVIVERCFNNTFVWTNAHEYTPIDLIWQLRDDSNLLLTIYSITDRMILFISVY